MGLLALMLLHESRRAGEPRLPESLSCWRSRPLALEPGAYRGGSGFGGKSPDSRLFGAYTRQAAIAAVHAESESTAATDWRQIVALYYQLVRIHPSPVAHLSRAVAIAMRDGPEAGLKHIDAVLAHGEFANYYLAHSAVWIFTAGWAEPPRPGPLMRKLCADPTGAGAAFPAGAYSAAQIKTEIKIGIAVDFPSSQRL